MDVLNLSVRKGLLNGIEIRSTPNRTKKEKNPHANFMRTSCPSMKSLTDRQPTIKCSRWRTYENTGETRFNAPITPPAKV